MKNLTIEGKNSGKDKSLPRSLSLEQAEKNKLLLDSLVLNVEEKILNFFNKISNNWIALGEECIKDNILNFLKSLSMDENIIFENDKIIYHFENLDVIFLFKSDGSFSLDSISYNLLDDSLDEGKKYEVLYAFFSLISSKGKNSSFDIGSDSIAPGDVDPYSDFPGDQTYPFIV